MMRTPLGMRSVRARLTAWYSVVLAVILIAFSAITYGLLRRQISRTTDGAIASTARELAAALSNESGETAAGLRESDAASALLDFRYSNDPIIIFSHDGREVASSLSSVRHRADRAAIRRLVAARAFGFTTLHAPRSDRLLIVPVRVLGKPHVLAILHPLDEQERTFAEMRRSMALAIALALLIASAGGYLLARKTLAPVEEAYDSQRRFMADASHELRTPVAILQGEIDVSLSRDDRDAEEYRRSLQIMHRSVRKLTRIVRDLFLLARADSGAYPLQRQRFYLDEMLGESVDGFRTLAAERGIELQRVWPADLLMAGDEDLVQRMIGNLVENAIKYTPEGGTVAVSAAAHDSTYRLEVRDSGPGIPPELRDRLFQRFFRGGGAGRDSGAGLGLPIARWIAEAHGGKIWIEGGSTFVVEMPRVSAGGSAAAHPGAGGGRAPPWRGGLQPAVRV
jgi:signal transduction histidine kinase